MTDIFTVFLTLSRNILRQFLKVDHDHLHHNSYTSHYYIQQYTNHAEKAPPKLNNKQTKPSNLWYLSIVTGNGKDKGFN
jgi:hypothetical protein